MKPQIIRSSWNLFAKTFPRLSCEIDLWRRNQYFENDLWFVPQFCRSDAGTIDIGVNEGVFSRWMAKFSSQVDCFECNPQLLPKLKRFLPRNVHLHECALSSSSGEAALRFDPINTGIGTIEINNKLNQNPGIRSIVEVKVPMRRLDEFNLDRVSFVKIDVEGHELEVLKGAAELIERERPTLLIEIEERHCEGNLDRVPQWLERFGYLTKYLDKSSDQLIEIKNIHDIARKEINNFWFVPRLARLEADGTEQ